MTTKSCDLDTQRLREAIQAMYTRVVTNPQGTFHFHRGPEYAAAALGYNAAALTTLPDNVTSAFSGIGNPLRVGRLSSGMTVVDIGCGAGLDLLLAARAVGPTGRAIGIEMTEAMASRARGGACAAGLKNVDVRSGDAIALPLDSAIADVVISNGVLNLVPEKEAAASEIYRVLKPGGELFLADIALESAVSDDARRDIDLWTAWIAGALPEAEIVSLFTAARFLDAKITDRFDCFRGTSKENVAQKFGVHGVNVFARKSR